MTDRPRRWRGYAALNGPDGSILWGSFRPTEAEARRFFASHNPGLEPVIVTIEIKTIDGK